MSTAHLIHGFLGAWKTTFAKKLEAELGAVRFSQDEWMALARFQPIMAHTLFGGGGVVAFHYQLLADFELVGPALQHCDRRGVSGHRMVRLR
jgi:hypothetical protein